MVGARSKRHAGRILAALLASGLLAACAPAPPVPPPSATDVAPSAAIDPAVDRLFARSCHPCHSDARRDPWIAKIAPSSWSLQGARATLDFSQWGRYDAEQRASETVMIADAVARGSMPPADYTFFNHGARLTEEDRRAVAAWAAATPAH